MFSNINLTPITFLVGFSASFLAFSGLESISQLSPVMKLPRRAVGKAALFLVILTVGITSPLLTMLSTLLLPDAAKDPVLSSQIISLLGGKWGTSILQTEVAISAGALLIFASNTAIIGSYHVFLALSRMEFFPQWLLARNKLHGTPHFSIAVAVLIPIAVLIIVHGNINILGDMYAFGLLGAFTLTCISIDIVRYRARKIRRRLAKTISDVEERERAVSAEEEGLENEQQEGGIGAGGEHIDPKALKQGKQPVSSEHPEPEGPWTRSTVNFVLGILTTVLVVTAWSTNLIAKPLATAFGGTVAVLGMLIAYINHRRAMRKGRIPVLITGVERDFPTEVLAVLVDNSPVNDEIINAALSPQEPRPVVFMYLGDALSEEKPELFRLIEPHLNDATAREILGRVHAQAEEHHIDTRFVYRRQSPNAIYHVWQAVQPVDTIVPHDLATHLEKTLPITYEQPGGVGANGTIIHLHTRGAKPKQSVQP